MPPPSIAFMPSLFPVLPPVVAAFVVGPLGALPDGQVALPDGNSAKFGYTLFLACLGPAPAV